MKNFNLKTKIQAFFLDLLAKALFFAKDTRAKFDMSKIMEVMMVVIMLPILTSMLTGIASTGNTAMDAMISAVTAIIPVMVIMDLFTGMFRGKK